MPKKFKDKRDFYSLASLYTGGLIDSSIRREGCNWDTTKNSLVAEEFFTMSLGEGTFQIADLLEFTNEEDYRKTFKLFCTAKADLYFDERRQKRNERIAALIIGVTIGIVSAYFGAYFKDHFSGKNTAAQQRIVPSSISLSQ